MLAVSESDIGEGNTALGAAPLASEQDDGLFPSALQYRVLHLDNHITLSKRG